jgi:hypothetical protein
VAPVQRHTAPMGARRRWLWAGPAGLAGALALAALALSTWWPVETSRPAAHHHPAVPVAALQPAASPPAAAVPAFTAAASASPDSATPPGVTPAQWAQLQAELAGRADGPAELQRLASYFAFADASQRFRRLRREQPASPELVTLARQLDGTLAERLQRQELSAPEARMLKVALLEVLLSDPVQRERELQAWQASFQRPAAAADAAARDAEFLRRQSELVAAWQARPPAQRNPRELEQQIEALRRTSYPTPGQ